MKIESKFNKGDKVYYATTEYVDNKIACPDCLGILKWLVVFPDGDSAEVQCQTCKYGFEPPKGFVIIKEWKPSIRELTIGSIRYNELDSDQFSYMCEETGIGSGSVYYGKDIFSDKEDAIKRSEEKYEEQMKMIARNNFSKKFGGTKELENALSTFGFSRNQTLQKIQTFRKWAKITKMTK